MGNDMDYLNGLIRISNYAGIRQDIVQAGGGNSSVKISDKVMLIKSSGFQLAEMTPESGYSEVNYKIIADYFLNLSNEFEKRTEKELLETAYLRGGRPSIETFLHSITGTFTLHTHPVVVNALVSRCGGMETLKSIFPDAFFTGYAKPGMELAEEYFSAYMSQRESDKDVAEVVFLKNHGLIVSAETPEEVIEKHEAVLKTIEKHLDCDMSAFHNATYLNQSLESIYGHGVVWTVNDKHVLDEFRRSDGKMWNYGFCPDCLVYCGKAPLIIEDENPASAVKEHQIRFGKPSVIVYKGNIYIYAASMKKALETQAVLSFSAQVSALNSGRRCEFLCEEDQNRILNWESEKYRQNIR